METQNKKKIEQYFNALDSFIIYRMNPPAWIDAGLDVAYVQYFKDAIANDPFNNN